MNSVSLVVTTYNWPAALALCLDSIAGQATLPAEVVVADDGSRPDTAALVQARAATFPVPLLHAWQDDLGFRAARVRNLALARTRGDYVIFLDGDMLLHPRFVADHLALRRPGIFLQGGRLNASQEETARLLAGGAPHFSPAMPRAPGLRGELKPRHALRLPWLARYKTHTGSPGVTMSCHMGIWRRDLERVNGFDDCFEGWGFEDDELAQRLRNAGVVQRRLRFAALAIHLWHATRKPEQVPGGTPNERRFRDTVATRRVRCEQGLDAHVARLSAAHDEHNSACVQPAA